MRTEISVSPPSFRRARLAAMGVVCALLGAGCERAAPPPDVESTSPAPVVAPPVAEAPAPGLKTAAAEPLSKGRMSLEAAPPGMRAAWYAARQAAAAEDPRFTLRPLGDTLLAVPALRGPGAVFTAEGVTLAGVEAALRPTGYQCDTVTRTAEPATPRADAARPNRVTYTHGETAGRFNAWYVHGPEGLEQGFDVDDPACRGTLRLSVALCGFTAAPADADGRVKLTPKTGGTALWYQDAAAKDARGKGLPVHLEGEGAAVSVVVDVRGAAFPVQIDPMLVVDSGGPPRPDETPGDGAINDKLGTSVAIDGDTAVVGAEKDGVGATLNQGSAYVFVRTNGTWALEGKLVAADGAVDDNFGHSVALSGDTAIVGANLDDANLVDQGSAYVFTRTNGVWTQQQKLLASAPSIGDQFGGSVSVDADVAVVGASLDDVGVNANMGTASIFARTNGVWALQALVSPGDGSAQDNFGVSVAVSANTVVVGANQDDTGVKTDHGSAYVFTRNGNTWPQTQKLVVADSATGDAFGVNVAIDGDTIAVAATLDDVGAAADEGTVYVYLRTAGVWALQDQLNALDLVNSLRFGLSLSLDADTISIVATGALAYVFVRDVNSGTWLQEARLLVPANAVTTSVDTTIFGFSSENVSGNNTQGSIYIFNRSNGAWGFPTNITTGDGDQADQFGSSVAISGNTAVVGVPGDHVLQATARGAAYVFVQNAGVWSREARLIANDGTQDDGFGNSVAIDADTIVVGASLDDVGAVADQGSAYVYNRVGGVWTQAQRLNATGGAATDLFGTAVALSADTIVVGAPQDDVGANANQGSAYVFLRAAGVWSQQAQLVAGDGAGADAFGRAVAVSGETALVGAPLDDLVAGADGGSAYVFLRAAGAWTQQSKLASAVAAANDLFGTAVALSGDTALVGAPQDDVLAAVDQGTATVFTRSGVAWTPQATLVAADGTAGDQFGTAVALDANTAVIGAAVDAVGALVGAGAAYATVRTGTSWCLQTRFTARDAAAGDRFGSAVAVSGARLLVGAPKKAGAAPFGNPNEGRAYDSDLDRNLLPNGQACGCAGECQSGFCTEGVCCNAACDGGACDSCTAEGTVGQCVIFPAGTECRAAADVCDGAEVCDGTAAACPNDGVKAANTECRVASDVCDLTEVCDGTNKACPNDAMKPVNTECRAATDMCDAAEVCTGAAKACPNDRVKAVNTECRAATDLCDAAEVCNGTLKTCPADVLKAANVVCRAAAGTCDTAEVCNGVVRTCPEDTIKAAGVECRAGVGACDAAEICDGVATACPADVPKVAGTECRPVAGPCDNAEICNGVAKTCPVDAFKNNATECRPSADLCDAAEMCTGAAAACPVDRAKALNTVCRAASDVCDQQEVCNGVALTCPVDAVKAVNTACRAASDLCDAAEVCDGSAKACPVDAVKAQGVSCRVAVGVCDAAETCDGAAKACPADVPKAAGVECRVAAGPCDNAEACDGAVKTCPADTFQNNATVCRPSADLCDAAELCPGNAAACPADANKGAGVICRAASDLCDNAEACTGAVKTCPADTVKAVNTACRPASDVCDTGEVCDGGAKACPSDAVKGVGVECRAANGVCDAAEACDGAVKACPGDAFRGAGVECRAANGVCDTAEACTGAARDCPADGFKNNATECRPAGDVCDAAEMCPGNAAACPVNRVSAPGTECRAAVGPCDAVETCDGQTPTCPEDFLLGPDAQCAPPSCADGLGTAPAFCDGTTIDCTPGVPESCGDYACGETACLVECLESAQCAAGAYCDQGLCLPLADDGAPCDFPGACVSGFCVDGVCCDQGCGGQCEACNEPETVGVCVPVAGAPRGDRPPCATDASVCGGVCDGGTPEACFYPAGESPCRDASCADGVATLEAVCAGDGTCPALQTQACAPFMCGATACLGDCVADADCAPGLFCSAGVCGNKRADGAACGRDEECGSNHCVDGVCCNAACNGQCEACDVAGHVGACVAVPFGSPHGGRAPCSGGGLCAGECTGNARDACEYPAAETTCLPATCANGVAAPASSCDGAGSCVVSEGSSCGAYACAPGGCLEACASVDDCAVGFFCVAGACTALLPQGNACQRPDQCASGFCVDGLCCDGACGGQCEACDVAGAGGQCQAVAGAPHGARSPCATDGGACGGTCDGRAAQACTYPGAQTTCRPPRCRDGVATVGATCDGAGACAPEQTVDCAPFACGPIGCLGNCVADADCVAGLYCAAGVCTPKLALGEVCAQTSQCAQGFCVDGVCCDTRCLGQCEACDVPGHAGACSVVVDAPPHGGRRACTGVGLCQGLCTGERRDVCGYPGQDVVCRPGDCQNGVATPESACDGTGACRRGARSNCGAYACGAEGCLDRCLDTADCAAGFECVEGACVDPAVPVLDAAVPPVDAGLMPVDAAPPPPDAFVPPPPPDAQVVVVPDAFVPPPPPDAQVVVVPDAFVPPPPPDARPPTDGPQAPDLAGLPDLAGQLDDKGRLGDGPLPADAAPAPADAAPVTPDLAPVVGADARPGVTGDAAPEADATTGPGEGGDDQGKSESPGTAVGGGCQCRNAGGGLGALWMPGLLLLWIPLRRRRTRS